MAKISEHISEQRKTARSALDALRAVIKDWPKVTLECTRPEGVTTHVIHYHGIADFLVVPDTKGNNQFLIKEMKDGKINVAFAQSGNITALYTKPNYVELVFGKACKIKLTEKVG